MKAEIQSTQNDSQIQYVNYSKCSITQKKGRRICLHDKQVGSLNSNHPAGQAGTYCRYTTKYGQTGSSRKYYSETRYERIESLLACKAQKLRTGYTGGRQLHA
jgi:hypothetical protein